MDKNQMREIIAKRVAKELKDGDVVNLGIGLPSGRECDFAVGKRDAGYGAHS